MKLSYANVVSTLALVVALGGGAYAAVELPKNSVGTKQIKKKAVTLAKVAPAARNELRGQTGPAGPQGPPGPVTETPRKVRWLAYRTTPFTVTDFGYGQLVVRTIGTLDRMTVCRTTSIVSAAEVTLVTDGSVATLAFDPGAPCYDGFFSPTGDFVLSGLGSRVMGTRPADGTAFVWELHGYDTIE